MGKTCGGNFWIVFWWRKGNWFLKECRSFTMENFVLSRSAGRSKCLRLCPRSSGVPSSSTCAPREAARQLYCRGSTTEPWLPLPQWAGLHCLVMATSACLMAQRWLIHFVCSCPYPSKSCIAAPSWNSDYHGNHKCSLVGFSGAWRLQGVRQSGWC